MRISLPAGVKSAMPVLWSIPVLLLAALIPAQAVADTLYLEGGSEIAGDITGLQGGSYTIETDFAGQLEVAEEHVTGVSMEDSALVTLSSGERLEGQLNYTPEQGQVLADTNAGDLRLTEELRLTAITAAEAAAAVAPQQVAVPARQVDPADFWSGDIALGMNGATGNTDTFGTHGRAQARRATNGDRLGLYIQGDFQEENGTSTVEEILTGASLERDINRDWFVHGNADFEKDEFEDLDLRAIANAGIGYFFMREEALIVKALAGVGYQHEAFVSGGNEEEGIVSLGYDLNYRYNAWLELLHKLTYFPSLSSPTNDYRVVSNLSAQLPIGNTKHWKVRLSLRNQYDSEPREGIEQLDTIYSLNLVYDWE